MDSEIEMTNLISYIMTTIDISDNLLLEKFTQLLSNFRLVMCDNLTKVLLCMHIQRLQMTLRGDKMKVLSN